MNKRVYRALRKLAADPAQPPPPMNAKDLGYLFKDQGPKYGPLSDDYLEALRRMGAHAGYNAGGEYGMLASDLLGSTVAKWLREAQGGANELREGATAIGAGVPWFMRGFRNALRDLPQVTDKAFDVAETGMSTLEEGKQAVKDAVEEGKSIGKDLYKEHVEPYEGRAKNLGGRFMRLIGR